MEPLFLTHKIRIKDLDIVLYDFQIRDHIINTQGIFEIKCNCQHSHNKITCPFRSISLCKKCDISNKFILDFQYLLFHPELLSFESIFQFKCGCFHEHKPPCGQCLNCKTNQKCIILNKFKCNISMSPTCNRCNSFNTSIHNNSRMIKQHYYDVRNDFFICKTHEHVHNLNAKPCFIQTIKCCTNAVLLTKYKQSFYIYDSINCKKYLIYNPDKWINQSYNRYISFLIAIVYNLTDNNTIENRYLKFIKSNFTVKSIQTYKSGRESAIRTDITGFVTKGIYQTSIISCEIPENVILLPQNLYDLAKKNFYLDYVVVKRDPSFHQTSAYSLKVIRNKDPEMQCIVIPDEISKPLNQDCDGDKNGIYMISKCTHNLFDRTESFLFKMSLMELHLAYINCLTLFAEPRYLISENNLVMLYRNRLHFESNSFFKRTYDKGTKYMIETGCGYNRKEYGELREKIIDFNKKPIRDVITLFDLFENSEKLMSIPKSGAKGSQLSFDILINNLKNSKLLTERKDELLFQMNRYVESSKSMSSLGHIQFIMLYSVNDLIAMNGNVYLNKIHYADLKMCSITFCFMFNEASLDSFVFDLING